MSKAVMPATSIPNRPKARSSFRPPRLTKGNRPRTSSSTESASSVPALAIRPEGP